MKKNYILIGVIILIFFILFSGFYFFMDNPIKNDLSCKYLLNNLDKYNDFPTLGSDCQNYQLDQNPIWVGGELLNISVVNDTSYNRNEFTMVFQGEKNLTYIYVGAVNETLPYLVGNFYRFDISRKCYLIHSAASSGNFYDPDLNAFYKMEC